MIGSKRFARMRREVPGTSLLPVPFAITAAVLVLLAATLTFDALIEPGRNTPRWLSVGNIDDARAILGAILAAVSTVLALIFSVTLLVFSVAISQFGPRLMPYFLRDRAMQVALGLFLATFLHSLMTFVVTGKRGEHVFVPEVTVLTSVVLALISFCYLVVYNHRVALAIQTNNVLARIVENLHSAISERSQLYQATGQRKEDADANRQRCIAEGGALIADTSGYVQKIDGKAIVRAANQHAAIICLAFRPGEFVLEGEVLARVLAPVTAAELERVIRDAVKIGQHRTLEQDPEFAFAQLSEIGIRALSPAINDTYTGLSAIDWLGDALRMFAATPAWDGAVRTSQGEIRLLVPPLRFARVVRAAFGLIRHAAATNPAVGLRLLQTCARLAPQLNDDEQRRAIIEEVEAVHQTAKQIADVRLDRDAFEEAYGLARDRLAMPGKMR